MDFLKLRRQWNVGNKIFFLFAVFGVLLSDLGVLALSAAQDVHRETQVLSENFIPRLIATNTIKDNVHTSTLSALDYITSGDPRNRDAYRDGIQRIVRGEVELFQHSTTEEDFGFVQSFQIHADNVTTSLAELVAAYDRGDTEQVKKARSDVAAARASFADFVNTEIQEKVQTQATTVREHAQSGLRKTQWNVLVVGLIAAMMLVALMLFVRRSLTIPLRELTQAAEDIGEGHFRLVHIPNRDELGLFAHTFNVMTQRIGLAQRRLEEELEKTKKLDHQKTEFLSIAAHQLRTPMSGIKWVMSMAIDGDFGNLTPEAQEQLDKGLSNVNRMIRLINSLLDVSQMDSGGLQYHFQDIDVRELLRDADHEVRVLAEKKGVTLTVEIPSDPFPTVSADKEKLGMAFHNLLDNAIKYTTSGGSVTMGGLCDSAWMTITVRDTGVGIPEEERDRIFTKFYRGSNIQTMEADGSGLGLFVVATIIKAHHGTIDFKSTIGQGTTFTIRLPLASSRKLT